MHLCAAQRSSSRPSSSWCINPEMPRVVPSMRVYSSRSPRGTRGGKCVFSLCQWRSLYWDDENVWCHRVHSCSFWSDSQTETAATAVSKQYEYIMSQSVRMRLVSNLKGTPLKDAVIDFGEKRFICCWWFYCADRASRPRAWELNFTKKKKCVG